MAPGNRCLSERRVGRHRNAYRELENALQRNQAVSQAVLKAEHQRELRGARGDSLAIVQRRQAAERQAQEQRAEVARRRLETRGGGGH